MSEKLPTFPERIRHSLQRPDLHFVRQSGVLATLKDDKMAILHGESRSESEGALPVFALGGGGSLAVPTGRVFVRFAEGENVARRAKDIADAGYEIEESPSYAPQAAWLRARSGDTVEALRGVAILERLAGIENVEPQMLMEAERKDDAR